MSSRFNDIEIKRIQGGFLAAEDVLEDVQSLKSQIKCFVAPQAVAERFEEFSGEFHVEFLVAGNVIWKS